MLSKKSYKRIKLKSNKLPKKAIKDNKKISNNLIKIFNLYKLK